MSCCACDSSCNHVGSHSFCAAHGGTLIRSSATQTAPAESAPLTLSLVACTVCQALRLEVERLKADLLKIAARCTSFEDLHTKIEAERDALKAALEEIAYEPCEKVQYQNPTTCAELNAKMKRTSNPLCATCMARAAIAGKKEEPK